MSTEPIGIQARGLAAQNSARLNRIPTVAGLGDSITAQNSSTQAVDGVSALNAKGDIVWARALLQGRFYFSAALNFGVSGQNSTQILARVGQVIAARPGFCRVLAGTNDPVTGVQYNPAATFANLQSIYNQLIAAGIAVIACPILPRSATNGLTAGELANAQKGFQWVNRRIRQYAQTAVPGMFYVMDGDATLLDQAQTTYIPIAGSTADGLHPVAAGAIRTGSRLSNVLDRILPLSRSTIICQQDVYDATFEPLGNRLPTGQLVGTGGTAGTGASGSVATGWALSRSTGTGATAVGSKSVLDSVTSEPAQVITLGGAVGTNGDVIQFSRNISPSSTTYAAGETLIAAIVVSGTGLSLVRNIALRVSDTGSQTLQYFGLNSSGNVGDRLPSTLPAVLIQTPLIPTQASSTALTFAVQITVDASAAAPAGDIVLSHASIRTPDPQMLAIG